MSSRAITFTNVWDQTVPPDTELANLLGQNLRDFRLDVQQRMGAISGLDASKPPFGSDAQPAAWNGVLFFATDTSKIYQWTNPNWVDVTASLVSGGGTRKLYQNPGFIHHSGTTSEDSLFSIPVPTLVAGNSIRLRFGFLVNLQGATASHLRVGVAANTSVIADIVIGSQWSSVYGVAEFLIGYSDADNATVSTEIVSGDAAIGSYVVINSAAGLSVSSIAVTWQSGQTTDSQSIGPVLAELIP